MDSNQENKSKEDEMFDKIFEFKMIGKQFQREAKKAENQQKKLLEKTKIPGISEKYEILYTLFEITIN